MRTMFLVALSLLIAAPVLASEREAHQAHPEEAGSLAGLIQEVETWSAIASACTADACDLMKEEARGMEDGLQALWDYLGAPEGKRAEIDAAYKDIVAHVDGFERWMPQADIDNIDSHCRRWSGTRERIDRFKRTLRQLAG